MSNADGIWAVISALASALIIGGAAIILSRPGAERSDGSLSRSRAVVALNFGIGMAGLVVRAEPSWFVRIVEMPAWAQSIILGISLGCFGYGAYVLFKSEPRFRRR